MPGYIIACLRHFVPVSALDVAWMKASSGRGSMYLEATVDADHRIHAVAISDRIGTENLLGYEDFSARTVNATGGDSSPLLGSRLALGDGNVAIPAALQRTRRATHFARDGRHHQQDVPRRLRRFFQKLKHMPPGRKDEVDVAMAELKAKDPNGYAVLTSVPLEQWCLAHMPVPTHGHTTSNMVEILACMLLGARRCSSLLGSLVWTMQWCRRRWQDLWDTASRIKREVRPVRQEASLKSVFERARAIHCSVSADNGILNVDSPIIVQCNRVGLSTLTSAPQNLIWGMAQAWDFVVDSNASSVRQNHSVRLSAVTAGDWSKVCSCGNVAHTWVTCPHTASCLQHHGLLHSPMFNKPWLFSWQSQLGRTSDTTVVTFSSSPEVEIEVVNVMTEVLRLARQGALLRVSQPPLSVRERRKATIKGDVARRKRPSEVATTVAQSHMHAASTSVCGPRPAGNSFVNIGNRSEEMAAPEVAINVGSRKRVPVSSLSEYTPSSSTAQFPVQHPAMGLASSSLACEEEPKGDVRGFEDYPEFEHFELTPDDSSEAAASSQQFLPTQQQSSVSSPSGQQSMATEATWPLPPQSESPQSGTPLQQLQPLQPLHPLRPLRPQPPTTGAAASSQPFLPSLMQSSVSSQSGQQSVATAVAWPLPPRSETTQSGTPLRMPSEQSFMRKPPPPPPPILKPPPPLLQLSSEPLSRPDMESPDEELRAELTAECLRESPLLCKLHYWYRVHSASGKTALSSLSFEVLLSWATPLLSGLSQLVSELRSFEDAGGAACRIVCRCLHDFEVDRVTDFVSCFSVSGVNLSGRHVNDTMASVLMSLLDQEQMRVVYEEDEIVFELGVDSVVNIGGGSVLEEIQAVLLSTTSPKATQETSAEGGAERPVKPFLPVLVAPQVMSFCALMGNPDVQYIILNRLLWDDFRTLESFDASGLLARYNLPLAGTCKAGLASISKLVVCQVANSEAPAALLQPEYILTPGDLQLIAEATQRLSADWTMVWNQEQFDQYPNVCPLNWACFQSTLGNDWVRQDAMDLMLFNLERFLPERVMMLNSAFVDQLLRRTPVNMARWRSWAQMRKTGTRARMTGWPYVRDGHWVAFWVDLEPAGGGPPHFYAMDSLNVSQGRRYPIGQRPLTSEFAGIHRAFVAALQAEFEKFGSSSAFGLVPSSSGWVTRMMDAGKVGQ